MRVFDSLRDLQVMVCTPGSVVLDTCAKELLAHDHLGRFVLRHSSRPTMSALVPGVVKLRKRDGSEVHVRTSWGTLTLVGNQVRVMVERAAVLTDDLPMAV